MCIRDRLKLSRHVLEHPADSAELSRDKAADLRKALLRGLADGKFRIIAVHRQNQFTHAGTMRGKMVRQILAHSMSVAPENRSERLKRVDGTAAVSYTHLDVYKRQCRGRGRA